MQVTPVPSTPQPSPPSAAPAQRPQEAATNAFGLSFESLLKIILTQLTYQDPLKPMDNYQFVSQLAQFSQLQLEQASNDKLDLLATAQATGQAASLLGRTVDVSRANSTVSGKVTAVAFAQGEPRITIQTADGQTISQLSMSSVSQIREGN